MNNVKYIKSFSNGQVTIPKDIRDSLGIGENFWLKLFVSEGKIIAEPMEENQDKQAYKKTLLGIKTVVDLEPQVTSNRKQVERQISKRAL